MVAKITKTSRCDKAMDDDSSEKTESPNKPYQDSPVNPLLAEGGGAPPFICRGYVQW